MGQLQEKGKEGRRAYAPGIGRIGPVDGGAVENGMPGLNIGLYVRRGGEGEETNRKRACRGRGGEKGDGEKSQEQGISSEVRSGP